MYDADGLPSRAVVIEAGSPERASGDGKSDAAGQSSEAAGRSLAAGEKEKLERELERWSELKQEERGRIEDRLKALAPSAEREQLLKEYGRRLLGIKQ
jgi:hypothetical protein